MLFLISIELLTILTVIVRVQAIAISLSDSDTRHYSWDIRAVVEFTSSHKSSTSSTLQLAKKTATLLALVNADRCSNLPYIMLDSRWCRIYGDTSHQDNIC